MKPVRAEVQRRNAEACRIANRKSYALHREERQAQIRAYAQAHPEERRQREREWSRSHPLNIRQKQARRRAKDNAAPIEANLKYQNILMRDVECYLCGSALQDKQFEFDHMVPLSRGGSHSSENVRVVHTSCNRRKWNRIPEEL
jgi:5-methylcytosine-specific restriction endonuclease McrA